MLESRWFWFVVAVLMGWAVMLLVMFGLYSAGMWPNA